MTVRSILVGSNDAFLSVMDIRDRYNMHTAPKPILTVINDRAKEGSDTLSGLRITKNLSQNCGRSLVLGDGHSAPDESAVWRNFEVGI